MILLDSSTDMAYQKESIHTIVSRRRDLGDIPQGSISTLRQLGILFKRLKDLPTPFTKRIQISTLVSIYLWDFTDISHHLSFDASETNFLLSLVSGDYVDHVHEFPYPQVLPYPY